MAGTYIQIRTDEKDKQEASKILKELGTNLSAVLNMTIKQIILQRRIPFDVALPKDEAVSSVAASMAMENMALTQDQITELEAFHKMTPQEQEESIQRLKEQYKTEG
ncbi:MAG: type II toxin-antitoxin system RelB/DinJ family antitoxin [Pseudoramibacter sp.]|jgi:addiction module RelB/DinJ family antitoxin